MGSGRPTRLPLSRATDGRRCGTDLATLAGMSAQSRKGGRPRRIADGAPRDVEIAGVALTHPERVLFPSQGITKRALAEFYVDIAGWIMPGLAGRPLSLVRCPSGRGAGCFFQKHPGAALAEKLPHIRIREKTGAAEYSYVRTRTDLIALVQAGTLELHVWGSRIQDLERPDLVVFDLDPAPGVAWIEVVRTARSLRDRLLALGHHSYARTTGGKGLHVVVPLEPESDWTAVGTFARVLAQLHAADDPERLTANMAKAHRHGRIFIDYLRNARGATAIASYSTRAHAGGPVATPVRWDELRPSLTSDRFRVGNLRRRLAALHADPWEDFEHARRPLTSAARTLRYPR
jgi:bifunctional non-homologous end joining protein LigD